MGFSARTSRTKFSREQLLNTDYDPLLKDLIRPTLLETHKDYLQRHGLDSIDHVAAVRGILVHDMHEGWKQLWDWGKLHDEILAESQYPRLCARYRNQRQWLPRIELEPDAEVEAALQAILNTSAILPDDKVNITCLRGRFGSIGEALGHESAANAGSRAR
jgi:hypothetical protein